MAWYRGGRLRTGTSSTSTLQNTILSLSAGSSECFSKIGEMNLHGPHHGAQKSITTGLGPLICRSGSVIGGHDLESTCQLVELGQTFDFRDHCKVVVVVVVGRWSKGWCFAGSLYSVLMTNLRSSPIAFDHPD